MKSIEEKIEDYTKKYFTDNNIKYYCKTEPVNEEIDKALKEYISKTGGDGGNYPDIKLLSKSNIPIMIEAKGEYEKLLKFQIGQGLSTKQWDIQNYALNGAVHYCRGIVNNSKYEKCLAIGITGNEIGGKINIYVAGCWVYKMHPNEIIRENIDLLYVVKEYNQ